MAKRMLDPLPPIDCGSGHPAAPVVDRLSRQPGVQKVPSASLTLFLKRRFITPQQCAALIEHIDAQRRPSTVSDFNGDAAYRTSETCDFAFDEALAIVIDTAICGFMGLDSAYGEPLQGQRYDIGQEFKSHTDYFDPLGIDYEKYCSVAGQRTWTAMIYLNEPVAGGATRFKTIDKIIQPEIGKLLMWNNRQPDGSGNPATLHQGMKVRAGTKYVLTKWFANDLGARKQRASYTKTEAKLGGSFTIFNVASLEARPANCMRYLCQP